MKLENQVSNLELSRKLKELGVKQESLFYYQGVKKEIDLEKGYALDILRKLTFAGAEKVSAFTVAELGEILPAFSVGAKGKTWGYNFVKGGKFIQLEVDFDVKSEANARAKMLIYLIENKLLKV